MIDEKQNLIPEHFTKVFILDAASFTLSYNNFHFGISIFLQLVDTEMGTKFALPYACPSVGYLKETLFPPLLPLHFTLIECYLIEELFKRFLDDGFVLWQKDFKKSWNASNVNTEFKYLFILYMIDIKITYIYIYHILSDWRLWIVGMKTTQKV